MIFRFALLALAVLPAIGHVSWAQTLKLDTLVSAPDVGLATIMPIDCNANGDVFVRRYQASSGLLPLIKVSPDGKLRSVFDTRDAKQDVPGKLLWRYFTLGDDGSVYLLVENDKGEPYVLEYSGDGKYQNAIKLTSDFEPMQLVVFRDGAMLVSGSTIADGNPSNGLPAIGVFDKNGKLVRAVQSRIGSAGPADAETLAGTGGDRSHGQNTKGNTERPGAATPELGLAATDGMNAYSLRQGAVPRVTIISESEMPDRKIAIEPPDPSITEVSRFAVSSGRLMVEFVQPHGMPNGNAAYTLRIYDESGQVLSTYNRAEDVSGVLACTDWHGSFTVLTGDRNGAALLHASAR
jgi:hypothetical protein